TGQRTGGSTAVSTAGGLVPEPCRRRSERGLLGLLLGASESVGVHLRRRARSGGTAVRRGDARPGSATCSRASGRVYPPPRSVEWARDPVEATRCIGPPDPLGSSKREGEGNGRTAAVPAPHRGSARRR